MVAQARVELATPASSGQRSTDELPGHRKRTNSTNSPNNCKEEDGGAVRTHLELPKLLSQDIMIIAKKFVELECSLHWIKTILNEQPQKKDHLIL